MSHMPAFFKEQTYRNFNKTQKRETTYSRFTSTQSDQFLQASFEELHLDASLPGLLTALPQRPARQLRVWCLWQNSWGSVVQEYTV